MDVERLDRRAGLCVALRLKADLHRPARHARQQAVGLLLDVGDGAFDQHGLHAILAKGALQLLVEALLLAQRPLLLLALDPLPAQILPLLR